MPIKHLPFELQPREKASINGVHALNDAELIALFLRTGHRQLSVIGLANLLLSRFKDLNQLARATLNEIKKIKGIGNAKALEIIALFEVAKRINNRSVVNIKNFKDAISIARQLLPNHQQEHFVIVVLASDNRLLYRTRLLSGREDSVELSPRLILAEILKRDGAGFYCFHNHPSGNLKPSAEDVIMTESLTYYCNLFGIKLYGHFVLTEKSHCKILISDAN